MPDFTRLALVTGASGFIGQVLCKTLLKWGYRVIGIARKPSEVMTQLERDSEFQALYLDITKDVLPKDMLDQVDAIFHLAGLAHAGKKSGFPEEEEVYHSLNVLATESLMKQAMAAKVRRFVFFSSVKAIDADDVYGVSKREAEQQLLALAAQGATEVVILRPALVYGPNLKGNLRSMQRAIQKGYFPPPPETHNRRSLISAQDLAVAAVVVAEHPMVAGKTYVVTDGQPYSTRHIYEALCLSRGRKPASWAIPPWVFRLGFTLIRRPDLYQKLLGSAFYADQSSSLTQDTAWVPQLRLSQHQQWQDANFLLDPPILR